MPAEPLTFLAVADVEIVEDKPLDHFRLVQPLFDSADLLFGQLEIPLANVGEHQLHGGLANRGWNNDARAGARALADIGFDVMSHASNHTMDMSESVLTDTMNAVAEETGIRLIGVGRDVDEARRPAIVEIDGTRFGFLAYCSVPIANSWAERRVMRDGSVRNRGGVNPLRAFTYYHDVDYQPGNKPRIVTETRPEDLAAMIADIEALRPQVDVLVVSQHWGVHFEPATIAMYQVEAAHAAIDAGADLLLGHHPHTIKGIEYYRGKAVLYGMPNFTLAIRDEHEERSAEWTTLESEKSFIAKIVVTDKTISRISIIPCHLDYATRQPEPLPASDPRAEEIRRYLEWVDRHNTPDFWVGTGVGRAFPAFDTVYRFEGDEILVLPAGS
jgi:poly-gamma-glutamate capsule biosynthesis protein CapA/YwtB (metallophosphatase superfamily)